MSAVQTSWSRDRISLRRFVPMKPRPPVINEPDERFVGQRFDQVDAVVAAEDPRGGLDDLRVQMDRVHEDGVLEALGDLVDRPADALEALAEALPAVAGDEHDLPALHGP